MPLVDYGRPKARRAWLAVATVAFALGYILLFCGYNLTQEVIRIAAPLPDAVHTFGVTGKYYVAAALGVERTLSFYSAVSSPSVQS